MNCCYQDDLWNARQNPHEEFVGKPLRSVRTKMIACVYLLIFTNFLVQSNGLTYAEANVTMEISDTVFASQSKKDILTRAANRPLVRKRRLIPGNNLRQIMNEWLNCARISLHDVVELRRAILADWQYITTGNPDAQGRLEDITTGMAADLTEVNRQFQQIQIEDDMTEASMERAIDDLRHIHAQARSLYASYRFMLLCDRYYYGTPFIRLPHFSNTMPEGISSATEGNTAGQVATNSLEVPDLLTFTPYVYEIELVARTWNTLGLFLRRFSIYIDLTDDIIGSHEPLVPEARDRARQMYEYYLRIYEENPSLQQLVRNADHPEMHANVQLDPQNFLALHNVFQQLRDTLREMTDYIGSLRRTVCDSIADAVTNIVASSDLEPEASHSFRTVRDSQEALSVVVERQNLNEAALRRIRELQTVVQNRLERLDGGLRVVAESAVAQARDISEIHRNVQDLIDAFNHQILRENSARMSVDLYMDYLNIVYVQHSMNLHEIEASLQRVQDDCH